MHDTAEPGGGVGPELSLARAIGLACGHAFADVRTMTPGPNTVSTARAVRAYLAADGFAISPAAPPPSDRGEGQ